MKLTLRKLSGVFPLERMKMRDPHVVPLARQALECFRDSQGYGLQLAVRVRASWFPAQADVRQHR